MPQSPTTNDLNLTFRIEEPREQRPSSVRGGWVVLCLLGIVMGVCGWWVSKQLLVDSLAEQLVESESRGDALVSLQRLSLLGDDATEPLCRALLHQDDQVAKAAYLMLDGRITDWQQNPAENQAALSNLARLLNSLPGDTLPTRLALASSLATRMLVFCSGQSALDFDDTVGLCEAVVSRSSEAQFSPAAAIDAAAVVARTDALNQAGPTSVPPPLPPVEEVFTEQVYSLSDSPEALGSPTIPVYSSSSTPAIESMARVQLGSPMQLAPNQAGPTPTRLLSETSASYRVQPLETTGGNNQPELVRQSPAATLDGPLQDFASAPEIDLASIGGMTISQLVRLLAAEQPKVAQTAALALRAKNMDDGRIELASHVASELAQGSREGKIKIAQDIAIGDIDPIPWLLWIAEDDDPEVRKTAFGLLHGQVDDSVARQLRSRLGFEPSPVVANTLRQVLARNPGNSVR